MNRVIKDRIVSIRYIMKDAEGGILEDTMNATPVSYLHGAAGIHPLLQAQLEGLKAGDKKKVYLLKESGLTPGDISFEVIIDEVRLAMEEEILLGYPVARDAQKCEADCICYNEQ
jgi:FKBP-type peptidyl-prolyl cis-trans isomerase 2